ncbi:MAG: FtsX-like permease family protein, partial [Burkholderiales bacterium]
ASLDLAGRGYNQQTGAAFLSNLLPRLAALPGVDAVSAAGGVPLDVRGLPSGKISIEGRPDDPLHPLEITYYNTTPGYFATLGVPFVDGRDLSPLNRTDLPLDAVVNEEMARRCWPGASSIGRRFEVGGTFYTVAGVVRNAKYVTLNESLRPAAWLTLRAQFIFSPTLCIRVAAGAPAGQLPAIRHVIRGLDADLALTDTRTFAQHIENNLILQRAPARMLSVLGPLALALAAIGLYAVIAYSLAQRMQEIGVRLALGATPQTVVRMMIWQGLRVVLAGAAIGLLLSFVAGFFLRKVLVGVPLGDPLIYGGVPALLLGVALLACWLPARRAAKVDPMVALRAD